MAYEENVSPTREYEVTMATPNKMDVITELVTLPETLANNRFVAQIYWRKYVPEGYAVIDAQPFVPAEVEEKTEESAPEYIGFGDELNYVGSDKENPDGFVIPKDGEDEDLA